MAKPDAGDGKDPNTRVVVSFQTSTKKKEELQEHADEEGFRNMSSFIRTALEKELNDQTQDSEGVPDQVVQQMGEVLEGMDQLQEQIHEMDSRIRSVETQVRHDPEVKELANDVFRLLPTRDQLIDWAQNNLDRSHPHDPSDPVCYSGTVEDIARSGSV